MKRSHGITISVIVVTVVTVAVATFALFQHNSLVSQRQVEEAFGRNGLVVAPQPVPLTEQRTHLVVADLSGSQLLITLAKSDRAAQEIAEENSGIEWRPFVVRNVVVLDPLKGTNAAVPASEVEAALADL